MQSAVIYTVCEVRDMSIIFPDRYFCRMMEKACCPAYSPAILSGTSHQIFLDIIEPFHLFILFRFIPF